MGKTLAEKIIEKHLVSGTMKTGQEIAIKIDQTLTQDATGTLVYLQFAAMGIPRVKTEFSVSYVDHNTSQGDFKNMDDHRFLQSAAKKYGVYFSPPGNGICHQVHLERFGAPGKTLLGSDSHTPTSGGIGMISIGAGGIDIAAAMAGAPFYMNMPEIIGVKLTGKLQRMCSAKDVILTLLKLETVKGGVGKIYEYHGPGVASLSVPERATITNMGAELGATTSLFPSDEVTKIFLELEKRPENWTQMKADDDAQYGRVIEINLDEVVPLAAVPHSPDKVVPVKEIAGIKVDQVVIGSCTNSSINDLGIAADILDGKRIHEGVQLGIAPGTRQVILSAVDAGIMSKLVEAGGRILESACGPCIGMGFAPCSNGVSARTFNRNFPGRSGTKDAQVYLVSPETAAAAALKGEFTDPRDIPGIEKKDYVKFIKIDDRMVLPPDAPDAETEVVYGPNIKPVPLGVPVQDTIAAQVIIKTGDNITTDHIMPAGSKILPLRSNIPEISKHVFEQVDAEFYNKAQAADAGLIIGGDNYGQGSSREHAALAPMYLKIKAVIAKSFARIHKANLINFGILPLEFQNSADYDAIDTNDELILSNVKNSLSNGNTLLVKNKTKNTEFTVTHSLAGRFLDILLNGGLLNTIKANNQV